MKKQNSTKISLKKIKITKLGNTAKYKIKGGTQIEIIDEDEDECNCSNGSGGLDPTKTT
ncbi:hypothetical protein [Aquimarina aggregata]|uniref:hypothetical protein n=1 Tax=Aquimarina aggregata TaxID=1642818 RepID=UPI000A429D34|nr:hypothetical protein [Aquimarina aggregata]